MPRKLTNKEKFRRHVARRRAKLGVRAPDFDAAPTSTKPRPKGPPPPLGKYPLPNRKTIRDMARWVLARKAAPKRKLHEGRKTEAWHQLHAEAVEAATRPTTDEVALA